MINTTSDRNKTIGFVTIIVLITILVIGALAIANKEGFFEVTPGEIITEKVIAFEYCDHSEGMELYKIQFENNTSIYLYFEDVAYIQLNQTYTFEIVNYNLVWKYYVAV